jgi:hypothetical protein
MEEQRLDRIAKLVVDHLAREYDQAAGDGLGELATLPRVGHVESMLRAGFWASLRREEGRSPRISMAFLSPAESSSPLRFHKRLPLTPEGLTRLAPAVERPGIHLGVWDGGEDLHVWGACRTIPPLCFVLEVVEPGLLVVKHQRSEGLGKFANLAVIQGEQVRVVSGGHMPMLSDVAAKWIERWSEEANGVTGNDLLVQLGASMRAHGKGGTLLIVPSESDTWRESIVRPVSYAVDPPFTRLRELLAEEPDEVDRQSWAELLRQTISSVAGLTAVDGATVMNNRLEILAFGAKIGRRPGCSEVEEILLMEPVVDAEPERRHPLQIGGTRHLSAAQFVQDQHESLALVASQDGRFTTFSWLSDGEVVGANRVEVLLL